MKYTRREDLSSYDLGIGIGSVPILALTRYDDEWDIHTYHNRSGMNTWAFCSRTNG